MMGLMDSGIWSISYHVHEFLYSADFFVCDLSHFDAS